MPRYFAYGSNMSSDALRGRCPSARPLSRAVLPEHRLIFFLEDVVWDGGGVAGVVPCAGEQVEGVLYELDAAELSALDEYEDVDSGDYVRTKLHVLLPDGPALEAWIYLPGRDAERAVPPAPRYVAAILSGAREHGLSPDYLARLEALP